MISFLGNVVVENKGQYVKPTRLVEETETHVLV